MARNNPKQPALEHSVSSPLLKRQVVVKNLDENSFEDENSFADISLGMETTSTATKVKRAIGKM